MDLNMEDMIKKYFYFIVDDYKFSYNDRVFSSDKLELRITLEREPPDTYFPSLYFGAAGEPDFTVLTLHWLLYYFEMQNHILIFTASLWMRTLSIFLIL